MEGEMPVFMKYDGIDGEFSGGDDRPTETIKFVYGVLDTADDGLLLPAVQDHGLLLPAVQDDGLVLVTDADPKGAIAGIIIAATSDNNRSDDGADYSRSHLLYQDVMIPTPAVAMETLTIAHEGFLLI
jgi:hypothetical protein